MTELSATQTQDKDHTTLILSISIVVFSLLALGSAFMPWVCRGAGCRHWSWSFEAYAIGVVPIVGAVLGAVVGIIALVKRRLGRTLKILTLVGGLIAVSSVPITFAIGRPNWNWATGMTFCLIGGGLVCLIALTLLFRGSK
jgi:hypothetical protein